MMNINNYCAECDQEKPCECNAPSKGWYQDLLIYGQNFMDSDGNRISPNEVYKNETK